MCNNNNGACRKVNSGVMCPSYRATKDGQHLTGALAERAMPLEEFLAAESEKGRPALDLAPVGHDRALLHGHCHQKAFDRLDATEQILDLVPELDLLSAVRAAPDTPLVADGTRREVLHAARVLAFALPT